MIRLAALIAVASVVARIGVCGPIYTLTVPSAQPPIITGSTPQTVSTSGTVGSGTTFEVSAHADNTVGASVSVFAPAPHSLTGTSINTFAEAESDFDDIIVSGPAATTMISLTIPFDAIFSMDTTAWSGPSGISHAGSSVDFQTIGSFGIGSYSIDINYVEPAVVESDGGTAELEQISLTQLFLQTGPGVSPPEAGIRTMQQLRLSGMITLPEVEVQTGVPQFLSLFVYAAASASGSNETEAGSGTFGSHTFGPAFGVPVFSVEPGFTVNSESMRIVNNVIAETSIPEPFTSELAALGIGTMLAGALKRARAAKGIT